MSYDDQRIAQRFATLSPEARRGFLGKLQAKGLSFAELPIVPADRSGGLPLSYAQQGLWLTWQMDPLSPAYNLPGLLRWSGALDVLALQRSLDEVVERHEALRTVFRAHGDGQADQVVQPAGPVPLPLTEATGETEDDTMAWAWTFARQPFALDTDWPFRAALRRTASDQHQLALAVHHIAADGWSLGILIDELMQLYEAHAQGRSGVLPALPIQPADHAVWQRHWMEAGEQDRQLAYWRARLGGEHPVLAMSMDRPRTGTAASPEGRHRFVLPLAVSQDLRAVARACGASLYMMMMAGFQLALHRFSGQTDLRVGAPIAGRERAETRGLVGHLVNVQVLRTELDPSQGFEALLGQVRGAVLQAHEHRDLPFDLLVEALAPPRLPGVHPLFQVKCTEVPALPDTYRVAGVAVRLEALSGGQAHFDLSFDFIDQPDGIHGVFSYAAALFDEATMARLAQAMVHLMKQGIEHPARPLHALTLPEPLSVLRGDAPAWPARDVLALWDAHVRADPGAPAVQVDEERHGRGELDAQADALALALRAQGVGPDVAVGLLAERSANFVLGLLAILKAGGCCVPLDPALPAERLRFQCTDSGARVLLHGVPVPAWADGLATLALSMDGGDAPGAATESRRPSPPRRPDPAQAAYVIYTSGSTGQPKGVVVSHGALAIYVQGVLDRLALPAEATSMGMVSTVGADLGHTVLFGALCAGRVLHLLPAACAFDPDAFADYLRRHRVDVLKIVPSHLQALMQAADPAGVLPAHTLIVGGEAISATLLSRIHALKPACRVVNHYGPTETTVGVLAQVLPTPDAASGMRLPLGSPLAHTQAFVLDAWLNPVPAGVAGELYLGGAGLARGYGGRPGLTAERFVAHPFAPGQRVYRTGDQVRLRADGALEFLGRLDDQVKVRGYRVELREVAAALLALPGVREAEVVARPTDDDRLQLHAYVIAEEGGAVGACVSDRPSAWLSELSSTLPEHMLPSSLTLLEAWPLNANGKVDRRALPWPAQASQGAVHEPPLGEVEQALAAIWSDVLGVDRIGRGDQFFALGGDSILVLKVVARARKRGLSLLPRQLFEHPGLRDLAEVIGGPRASTPPMQTVPRLDEQARHAGLPLSHAQERLWFLWQLEPGSSAYHIAGARRLLGLLDVTALRASVDALVDRHEALRTVFRENGRGQAEQFIAPQGSVDWSYVDVRDAPNTSQTSTSARDARAAAETRHLYERPFDLAQGPLLRVGLIRTDDQAHVLVVAMHHIVSDGWSMDLIVSELAAAYQARVQGHVPPVAPLPLQYADYASWQRGWLAKGERDRQLAYWTSQLGATHPVLQLPADHPRQATPAYRAARHAVALPDALAQALKQRAQLEGTTVFVLLLAGLQALLHRYTGQADVRVGVPVANRDRPECQGIVGVFVNTQVHRNVLDGRTTLAQALRQARDAALGAQAHQDLPFEQLVEALQPERSLSHTPLFQVMFNHQRTEGRALDRLGDLAMESCMLGDQAAQFELSLDTQEDASGRIGLVASYAAELFEPDTIDRFTRHYLALLTALSASPERCVGDVALLDTPEQAQLATWGDRLEALPEHQPWVHHTIEAQARRTPEALAVVLGMQSLSYQALNQRANQLAHHLIALGVGPDTRVGVALERSIDMVVALLGVLKAGAAYVPLDPRYPAERLAHMVDDSGLRWLLTQAGAPDIAPAAVAGALPGPAVSATAPVHRLDIDAPGLGARPAHDPGIVLHPDHLAYVIYTSGSTGRPKGVAMSHGALAAHARVSVDFFGLTPADRMLQFATLNFDGCIEQIYPPLCVGATVVLRGPEMWDSETFHRVLVEQRISVADLTTAYWFLLVQDFARQGLRGYGALRQVHAGGEAMPPEGLRAWRDAGLSHVKLLNTYGPTEAAVTAAVLDCAPYVDGGEAVPAQMPIGGPLAGRRLCVLDADLNLAPVGVAGELCIGGDLLARGYLGRGGLTAERFIADPFDGGRGGRLYRTGDLVRWRHDGQLDYLGRIDQQVKVRGFRIELGEVEAQLLAQPGVREAVVMARPGAGGMRLVGYASPTAGQPLDEKALRAALGRALPDYMVPSCLVVLAALPLNANGKIDRAALPEPVALTTDAALAQAPQGPVETALAEMWSELLGGLTVGRHDHFFQLGGHSLLATQLVSRVRQAFPGAVPLAKVFELPVLSAFAQWLVTAGAAARAVPAPPILVIDPARDSGALSFAQQRLWFRWRLAPADSAFNLAQGVRLRGALRVPALQSAIDQLARRHAVLRTVFSEVDGEPVQHLLPAAPVDIVRWAVADEAAAQHAIEAEAATPFDLAAGPLWRVRLLQCAPDDHVLLVTLHHIAADGWSISQVIREFTLFYAASVAGTEAALPEVPVRYLDYALWQRRWLAEGESARQMAYWMQRLARRGPILALPHDRPAPPVRAYRAALAEARLDGRLHDALRAFAQSGGVTPFMPLLATLSVVFAAQSRQRRFVVGTDIANRNQVETEHLVGFFVNQIVLDIDCETPPVFSDLLGQVRDTLLGAADHQDLPFDRLVDALRVKGREGRAPLFDVKVLYQDQAGDALSLPDLAISPQPTGARGIELDLIVSFVADGEGLSTVVKYDEQLFLPDTIAGLMRQVEAVLARAIAEPGTALPALMHLAEQEAARHRASAQAARRQAMAGRRIGPGRRAATA